MILNLWWTAAIYSSTAWLERKSSKHSLACKSPGDSESAGFRRGIPPAVLVSVQNMRL